MTAWLVLAWLAAAPAAAPAPLGYYRFPSLHGDTVVFTAEGDLWRVGVSGGVAQRLTSHPAEESRPAISPDGTRVAFSARYEGPAEAHDAARGRLPRRLTWEGGSAQVGVDARGEVLYATGASRACLRPSSQCRPAGGRRQVVTLAQASDGAYDGTGAIFFHAPSLPGQPHQAIPRHRPEPVEVDGRRRSVPADRGLRGHQQDADVVEGPCARE